MRWNPDSCCYGSKPKKKNKKKTHKRCPNKQVDCPCLVPAIPRTCLMMWKQQILLFLTLRPTPETTGRGTRWCEMVGWFSPIKRRDAPSVCLWTRGDVQQRDVWRSPGTNHEHGVGGGGGWRGRGPTVEEELDAPKPLSLIERLLIQPSC